MGLWRSLESLTTPAAVLAEWRMLTGDEFDRARPYLSATNRQSDTFPCPHPSGCRKRHEVEDMEDGVTFRAVSPDRAVNCRSIALQPHDVVFHELDTEKLCGAIRGEFGFHPPARGGLKGLSRSHPVGFCGPARSPVVLTIASSEELLLKEILGLLALINAPFVLLAPTHTHCTPRVDGMLRKNHCAFVPLATALALGPRGKLVVVNPIDGILAEFDRARVARGTGLVKVVERIDRNIEAVANQNQELRAAKARLEAMQAEGLFAFASKIDPETLRIFFAVLASGDVAKASRAIGVSDSTLRGVIAGWKQRGKAYAALAEFVRWRKAVKGQAGEEFAKRLVSGGEREVDYPEMIRGVLEELETFNEDNWEEKVEELGELLRGMS